MAIKACRKDGLPGFKYGDAENAAEATTAIQSLARMKAQVAEKVLASSGSERKR